MTFASRPRSALRRIIPRPVRRMYRRLRPIPMWAGVYPDFASVPASDAEQRGMGWRTLLGETRYASLPPEIVHEHDYLALVAAVVGRRTTGPLRVVDFGGGLGIAYEHLRRRLHGGIDLDFHVVELEWACSQGSRLFTGDSRISFHPSPPPLANVDIVQASSSLQYVDDWRGLIRQLCAYRAEYVLLVDAHVGPFPTYATAEASRVGVVFPVWLLNRDELLAALSAGGYQLVLGAPMPDDCDQTNFPAALRLPGGRRQVLLFRLSAA